MNTNEMEEIGQGPQRYPKMLYRDGAFSSEQENQLIVAGEAEEEAAFAQGFCELVPVEKGRPKDAKEAAAKSVAAKVANKPASKTSK